MPRQNVWHRGLACVMALLLVAPSAAQDGVGFFAPAIEKSAPAVVNLYARKVVQPPFLTQTFGGSAFWRLFRDTLLFGYGQERFENSLGSGVIVSEDGVVVTNHHVVADADGIQLALTDGRVYRAEPVVSDKRTDIAVLRIGTREPLPFIEFGDSERLRLGDPVIAIGNPFGLGQTVTTGIVSALARTTYGIGDFRFFIQTDAAINPGNSGGALLSIDGKLIGINTAIYSTSGGSLGLGFAIPSSLVRRVVESAVHGRPLIFPWIGISGRAVPPHFAGLLGLPGSHGVLVADIYEGGPAALAGFRPGDVVLAVDGVPVSDPPALRYQISMQAPGKPVRLTVVRGGRRYDIPVTVVPPPNVPARDETKISGLSPLRGATVASLSPALAEEIGADSGISGVAVLAVGPASAAAKLGLRAGDIIRSHEGRAIATVATLLSIRKIPFEPWRMTISRAGVNLAIGEPAVAGFTSR